MDVGAVVAEAMEGIDGRASVSSGTLPDGQSDDDWHDGWEEQGHELQVSVKSLQDFLDHA